MSEKGFQKVREHLQRIVQDLEWVDEILTDPQDALKKRDLTDDEIQRISLSFLKELAEKQALLHSILEHISGEMTAHTPIRIVDWKPRTVYGSERVTGTVSTTGLPGKNQVIGVVLKKGEQQAVEPISPIPLEGNQIDLTSFDVGPIKDWDITGVLVQPMSKSVDPIPPWGAGSINMGKEDSGPYTGRPAEEDWTEGSDDSGGEKLSY